MTSGGNITTFAGLPVRRFEPGLRSRRDAHRGGATAARRSVPGPRGGGAHWAGGAVAWRIEVRAGWGEAEFDAALHGLIDAVGGASIQALVLGSWGRPQEHAPPLHLLVAARDRLPGLRALFIGEMSYDECEISWIRQGEIGPLLAAYPGLEVLHIRGTDGLSLSPVRHRRLRELCVESAGLPVPFVRGLADSSLPGLADLELWLGSQEFGGEVTVEDLAPILGGAELPKLRRLALRNAEIADELATALAAAPVVARLSVLDLSLGALSDAGAEALLTGQPLTHLESLELAHNFIAADLAVRLALDLPAVAVDVSDEQEVDEDGLRYVSVTE